MSESDSHRRFGSPMDGPSSRPTPPCGEDNDGSPRSLDASFSLRAVLSDPAGVSSGLASIGRLLLPSRFTTLSAPGLSNLTRLNRFTRVTAQRSLCLRLAHVVTSMSPRLDSRWVGSFPFRGGNFTRWKHQGCPGAPKTHANRAEFPGFKMHLIAGPDLKVSLEARSGGCFYLLPGCDLVRRETALWHAKRERSLKSSPSRWIQTNPLRPKQDILRLSHRR